MEVTVSMLPGEKGRVGKGQRGEEYAAEEANEGDDAGRKERWPVVKEREGR